MATQIQYDHLQLETLWSLAGGAPQWADTAAAVAQAESGGCLYAKAGPVDDRPQKVCTYRKTSTENSYGLWQINRFAHPTYTAATLYTALGNAKAAVSISSDGQDFTPWTTYRDGAYKQYLQNPGSLTPPPGSTGTPEPASGASVLAGFNELSKALARHAPKAIHDAGLTDRATYRRLAGKRG